jgi:hypothetical protein
MDRKAKAKLTDNRKEGWLGSKAKDELLKLYTSLPNLKVDFDGKVR